MNEPGIDPRYPAEFQRGGDNFGEPSGAVTNSNVSAGPEQVRAAATVPEAPAPAVFAAAAGQQAIQVQVIAESESSRQEGATHQAHDAGVKVRASRWLRSVPWLLVTLLLLIGLFALTAQYWFPTAMNVPNPATHSGVVLTRWGQLIYPAAPVPIGGGLALISVVLLLRSRSSSRQEAILRPVVAIFSVVMAAAGFFATFAINLFPEPSYYVIPVYDGTPRTTPFPWVVQPVGSWLVIVALLTIAALIVVPRRWQGEGALENKRSSVGAGMICGFVFIGVGAALTLASYAFPKATGSTNVNDADGSSTFTQGWADAIPALSPSLISAGVIILVWVGIRASLCNIQSTITMNAQGEVNDSSGN